MHNTAYIYRKVSDFEYEKQIEASM